MSLVLLPFVFLKHIHLRIVKLIVASDPILCSTLYLSVSAPLASFLCSSPPVPHSLFPLTPCALVATRQRSVSCYMYLSMYVLLYLPVCVTISPVCVAISPCMCLSLPDSASVNFWRRSISSCLVGIIIRSPSCPYTSVCLVASLQVRGRLLECRFTCSPFVRA